ncbi:MULTISPECIES: T9SS type A sorting domain-containing protein [Aquimarina]|uniref:T9SS type A sorting domain-containing protein n=1 Tax=Aquimarina TaxID=290174 RepID=UPI001358B6D3|nr:MULTISPECIES: T9SS type A sorting domain-containing protein [Aquimarina]
MKKIYLLFIFIGLICFSFAPGIQAQSGNFDRQQSNDTKIKGLRISPNPASGNTLYITSEKNLTKTVTIFTALSQKVMFKVLIGKELDISSLPPAIYIIRIKEEDRTSTVKFVKT